MLTDLLRIRGHEVLSFVENSHGEQVGYLAVDHGKEIPFHEWVASERGKKSFQYDTNGACNSDLVIYIGPSGCDAWAEVGAAWATGTAIFALESKGEQIGLMRRMATWFVGYRELLKAVDEFASKEQKG